MSESIIPIRQILKHPKIKTLPTFSTMCKKLGVKCFKKADCMIITGEDTEEIKKYVEEGAK